MEQNEKAPTIFGADIPLEPGMSALPLLLLLHFSGALGAVGAVCAVAACAVSCIVSPSAAVGPLLLLLVLPLLFRRGAGGGRLPSVYCFVVPSPSKPDVSFGRGRPL